MKMNLMLIALGTAVLAAPAAAESRADSKRGGTIPAAQEKKYCLQYADQVGSRISKQACKTKREWAKEGVDIDEVAARK